MNEDAGMAPDYFLRELFLAFSGRSSATAAANVIACSGGDDGRHAFSIDDSALPPTVRHAPSLDVGSCEAQLRWKTEPEHGMKVTTHCTCTP